MKEALIQYLWEHQLFCKDDLRTTTGEPVSIIHSGQRNGLDGTKFLHALIEINGLRWAGDVAIHDQASDWNPQQEHEGEHDSKLLDTVILHVVAHPDREVFRNNRELIPCLKMTFPKGLEERYQQLQGSTKKIPCTDLFPPMNPLSKKIWLTRLLVERIAQRNDEINLRLARHQQDYEETLHCMIARALGSSRNGDLFEQIAQALPLKLLLKHQGQRLELEALLFGMAGFLEQQEEADDYFIQLQTEFKTLRDAYHLVPLDKKSWNYLRLRPTNFPTLRLAQWAALIHQSHELFTQIIGLQDLALAYQLFQVQASTYWDTHYVFGSSSIRRPKRLGRMSIDSLLINTILPFLFSYGRAQGDLEVDDRVIGWFEKIPAEQNQIVAHWAALGWAAENAFESQALIQLSKYYCDPKACLKCRLGHQILSMDGFSSESCLVV